MADNNEIVKLIIDAENLSSDELKESTEDLRKLSLEAVEASRKLDQLKIDQDVLKSYDDLNKRIEELQSEIADSQVAYQKLNKEVKNNKDATDEQRKAAIQQNEVTKSLRKELRSTVTEQTKVAKKLRESAVDTKRLADEQQRLGEEISKTEAILSKQNSELDKHAKELSESIAVEKQSIRVAAEQAQALEKARIERQKEADAAARALTEKRRELEENGRITISLAKYEAALSKLNAEKQKGELSSGDYIRKEKQLRDELKLSEQQVSTSRRAIEADAKAKDAAVRSTDALTTVTRRLAQAYTVLIAAQSAASVVLESVKGYGELEAAITKVEKTTGNARVEVEAIADQLKLLSEDITPTATTELLRYAEVAGQLGTKSTSDILNLVAAADALEVSTNLAGDEASLLLARILGMTNQGIPAIQNLSSTVVDLGNNMKVAEDEIVYMTKEIVTGTREINLSAQASAALGATLAETGQQAERSRTAFFKLSDTIRRSITEGGDSIQKLAEITRQSVDELKANLTDRGEKIILDFVKGLARTREEGRNLTDVLKSFGIEGTEAGAVFSSLTDNVDVLEGAFRRADEAFLDGTKHIEEAAKAYADQESAVARLVNKFGSLKKAIGEALSDETDRTIRTTTQYLDEMGNELVSAVELVPEFIEGMLELGDAVNDLFNALDADVTLLSTGFNSLKALVNFLTLGMRTLSYGIQNVILDTMELYNALDILGTADIPTDKIEALRLKIEETRKSITTDVGDINNAFDRIGRTSSNAFEGLVDAVQTYEDALGKLDITQRAQIKRIIETTGYQQGQDELYRELTAALVRQNRELEINERLKLQTNSRESAARVAAYNEEVKKSTDASTAAIGKSNTAIREQIQLTNEQKTAIREQLELKKEGLLTEEMFASFVRAITGGLTEQVSAYDLLEEKKVKEVEQTKDLIAEYTKLQQAYTEGNATREELIAASERLTASYIETGQVLGAAAESTKFYSQRQVELNDQIVKAESNLVAYENALSRGINGEREKAQLLAKIALEQEKVNRLTEEKNAIAEIENANIFQLNELYTKYNSELQSLELAYESGRLKSGEYNKEKERLTNILNQLNALTNINTQELEKNSVAKVRNAQETEKLAVASRKAATAMSLELEAAKYLDKQFDFNSQSTEQLTRRYNDLQAMIIENARVSDSWYRQLAETSNLGFQREQQIISETLTMRKWQEQVESGSVSMERLDAIARSTSYYFKNLSGQQLTGLINSINEAKKRYAELDNLINDSIGDVEDRLARAEGREQDILKRQFERELEDYNKQLAEARLTGDSDLINKAREAIRKLIKAQQAELKQFQQEQKIAQQELTNLQRPQLSQPEQDVSRRQIDVNVTLPSGSATITTADFESARKLTDLLASIGTTNIEGDV